jgi:ABC-type transport system involved in multi-copper enzyme maturation permease subunit
VWGGGRKRERATVTGRRRGKAMAGLEMTALQSQALVVGLCHFAFILLLVVLCCVGWFDLVLSMAAIDPTDQRAIQQAIIKNLKQRYVNASITEILFQKHSDGYYHCFFEGCPHFLLGLGNSNNNIIIIIINRDL